MGEVHGWGVVVSITDFPLSRRVSSARPLHRLVDGVHQLFTCYAIYDYTVRPFADRP